MLQQVHHGKAAMPAFDHESANGHRLNLIRDQNQMRAVVRVALQLPPDGVFTAGNLALNSDAFRWQEKIDPVFAVESVFMERGKPCFSQHVFDSGMHAGFIPERSGKF